MGGKHIDRNNQVTLYVLTTDTKPTLAQADTGTVCYVIDETGATSIVSSIWVWYGTDWAEY